MLRGVADLIETGSQPSDGGEDKRKVVKAGRQYVESVTSLHAAIGSLIERIPRTDYPRKDALIRTRYES